MGRGEKLFQKPVVLSFQLLHESFLTIVTARNFLTESLSKYKIQIARK